MSLISIPSPDSAADRTWNVVPASRVGVDRLRAIILLKGVIGTSTFASAVGRSLLDLPVSDELSVLGLWEQQLRSLSGTDGESPEVRLVLSQGAASPQRCDRSFITIDQDPGELRGTGGVLYDVTRAYPDDAFILVATAAQILLQPLGGLVEQLARTGSDVSILVQDDGAPSGLMLIRRRCLELIPAIGFVDLKEQALPQIAGVNSVSVVRAAQSVTASIRTLSDYIRALRTLHRKPARPRGAFGGLPSGGNVDSPFAEQWQPAFSLIEDGAHVEPGARVHDSVVLAGGRVARNAAVIRCVVCGDGEVEAGATEIDQILSRKLRARASKS